MLQQETRELKRIVDAKYQSYDSEDPLDLGEACWLAHWYPEEEWSQARFCDKLFLLAGRPYLLP